MYKHLKRRVNNVYAEPNMHVAVQLCRKRLITGLARELHFSEIRMCYIVVLSKMHTVISFTSTSNASTFLFKFVHITKIDIL